MKTAIGLASLALCAAASAPLPKEIIVDLTLTPRAAEKLSAMDEGITIAAMYDGEPTRAHRKQVDEMGMIALGMDRVTVTGKAQRVVVPIRKLDRVRVAWVVGGQPHLLINVFTARRKNPDNLLNCDIYDGPLADIRGKPIAIKCDLI